MKEVFQAFINRTVQKVSVDPRILGVAIGGSWISNEIDEFSDLDLIIVCKDSDFYQIQKDRFEITKALSSHLSSFTGEHVGEPRLLICMFRDPLIHVDLKFVALKDFHERIENPSIAWEREGQLNQALKQCPANDLAPDAQWIEDRFWTWVHYTAAKIGRGELFEAIGSLTFLREKVLSPLALWTHQKPVREIRRIEQYLPDFAEQLRKTVPSYDRESCIDALKATVDIYKELRNRSRNKNLKINSDVEKEVLNYLSGFRR